MATTSAKGKKRRSSKNTSESTARKRQRKEAQASSGSDTDADEVDDEDDPTEAESPAVKAANLKKAKAAFEAKYDTKTQSNEEILGTSLLSQYQYCSTILIIRLSRPDLQRSKWRSKVYKHFHDPPTMIESPDGEVHYKFICKTKPSAVPLTRVRWDTSTGNLGRHLNHCAGKAAPPGQGINDFAHGSTYSKARMRYLCAVWVARHHRPFTIVQDDELVDIFRMLYSRVEVPHPTTLSRDVREIYEMTRDEIAKDLQRILQRYTGRLHIGIDGWTSPNVISFLGITVHRVVDGKMKSMILDFIK
ncbi:hypothetical protein BC629DRAFT_1283162 [Irpex lacteus]|nr:hypothetical protein BC629DRAFT_1283162 [Irpex lacteus]